MASTISFPELPPHCPRCTQETTPSVPFCKRCSFDLLHGSTERPRAGRCAFCEEERLFSEEHVFGKWQKDEFAAELRIFDPGGVHRIERPADPRPLAFTLEENPPLPHASIPLAGGPLDLVTRNVCAVCNNGWMSAVQDQAKPLIKALARGARPSDNPNNPTILAKYAIMVLMNLEYHSRIVKIPQFHRTTLMSGAVPDGWEVSIGITTDYTLMGSYFTRHGVVPVWFGDEDVSYYNLFSGLFCVGRLAVHAYASDYSTDLELAKTFGIAEGQMPTTKVWPVPATEITVQRNLTATDLTDIQRRCGYSGPDIGPRPGQSSPK